MILHRRGLATLLLLGCSALSHAGDVTVYAAASLTNALKDLAAGYQASHKATLIKTSFAASSILARQIEAGAPADLFASADKKWMDYLDERRLIANASRRDLLGNNLVLIAPATRPLTVAMDTGKAPAFAGKLCMGDPASVPAGRYGRQALASLGWWSALSSRVVASEDVRSALAFVERGDCPLGIVYETDARLSRKVMIAGRFPAGSHEPVVYPFALLPRAPAEAREFYRYLQGPEARAVFTRYGFTVLQP